MDRNNPYAVPGETRLTAAPLAADADGQRWSAPVNACERRGVVDFRLPGIEHRKKKRAVRPIAAPLLATLRRHPRRAATAHVIA